MRRHTGPIAVFFRSFAAIFGGVRRPCRIAGPASGMAKRLFVAFVAVSVLAASVVYANTASAHEVDPAYSCSSGTLDGTSCVTTTTETAPPHISYSCSSGTLDGTNCVTTTTETAPPHVTYSCSSGTLSGTNCVTTTTETAPPHVTYSCSSGTLSGTSCVTTTTETAPPHVTYSCSSGTLSGTSCVTTTTETAPPHISYSCSSGTLSGTSCVTTTTTSATASCSSGMLSGGQCLHTAAPNPDCPAGYQSGAFGICYKYTPATYSCSSGTLSGTSCVTTTTTAATPTATCPSGYQSGNFGICYRTTTTTTPAETTSSCPEGYQSGNYGICYRTTTTTTPAETTATCPSGYQSGNYGICYRTTTTTTPAETTATCPSGYQSGNYGICYRTTTTTTPAETTSSCPEGYQSGNYGICYRTTTTTTPAETTCSEGTWNDNECDHDDPPPPDPCPGADPHPVSDESTECHSHPPKACHPTDTVTYQTHNPSAAAGHATVTVDPCPPTTQADCEALGWTWQFVEGAGGYGCLPPEPVDPCPGADPHPVSDESTSCHSHPPKACHPTDTVTYQTHNPSAAAGHATVTVDPCPPTTQADCEALGWTWQFVEGAGGYGCLPPEPVDPCPGADPHPVSDESTSCHSHPPKACHPTDTVTYQTHNPSAAAGHATVTVDPCPPTTQADCEALGWTWQFVEGAGGYGCLPPEPVDPCPGADPHPVSDESTSCHSHPPKACHPTDTVTYQTHNPSAAAGHATVTVDPCPPTTQADCEALGWTWQFVEGAGGYGCLPPEPVDPCPGADPHPVSDESTSCHSHPPKACHPTDTVTYQTHNPSAAAGHATVTVDPCPPTTQADCEALGWTWQFVEGAGGYGCLPPEPVDPCPGADPHPVSDESTSCHSHPPKACHPTDTVTYQTHDPSAAAGHATVTVDPCPPTTQADCEALGWTWQFVEGAGGYGCLPPEPVDPCPGADPHPVSDESTSCHSHPIKPCHPTDTVTYQTHDPDAAAGHATVTVDPCPPTTQADCEALGWTWQFVEGAGGYGCLPPEPVDPCPGADPHPVSDESTSCHSHPIKPCHPTDTVTYQTHDPDAAAGHATVTVDPCPPTTQADCEALGWTWQFVEGAGGYGCLPPEPVDPSPEIVGLPAAGSGTAGTAFTAAYAVSPAGTSVSVSGTGCSNAADVSTGAYTLTATRPDAGTRTCTVTAGTATATITVTFAAAPTRAPSSPRNLHCSAATATTATWSWDAADRAHSYWYRYSRNDDWAQIGGQDARSHTRTGITPSSAADGWDNWRYIDVKANNNIGDSSTRHSSCLTLPPGWLTATCTSTGQITATWTKPLGLNSETNVRYTATATYGVPSAFGVGTLEPSTGTATTSTHTGTPGTAYTIRVQTQPIANKPTYSETTTATCELPPCSQDESLLGSAGLSNHRHGQGDCHLHDSSVPSCSISEDRAYTVHTDTLVGGEPTHRDGVVLACHPGRDQGVVSPQPLTVECGTDGKVKANWQSVGANRFQVEGDLQYSGTSQSKSWAATPLASYTIRVRALWDRFQQDPVTGPWTIRVTASCPASFAPRDVSAECNNYHGVVGVSWDKVGGADKYRINGPVELVGTDGYIEVSAHADSPQSNRRATTLQGEEAKTFSDISVQTFMNGQWSANSETASTKCADQLAHEPFLGFEWDRISRNCVIQNDEDGNPTKIRVCTEEFNEVLKLNLGGVHGWRRLPLIEWDSDDSNFENISANLRDDSTLGDLASLALGPTWGLMFSLLLSQKKMFLFMDPLDEAGGIEYTLYPTVDAVRKEAFELNGIDLSNVPDSAIELCLPDAGYIVAEPRMPARPTTTYSGYTTHYETVIHHCTGETAEGQD